MMTKAFLYSLLTFLILSLFLFTLPLKSQGSGIGVYAGWAFGLSDAFDWSSHRLMRYREGLNFQLGVYKNFALSRFFDLQAEAIMQHYYWKYEGSWSYSSKDYQEGVESEPVFKFCLNLLFKSYNRSGHCYYVLAGAGVRTGKVTMNLYRSSNLHFQGGLGIKFPLNSKFLINIMARISIDPTEESWRKPPVIVYPGLIVGLEF